MIKVLYIHGYGGKENGTSSKLISKILNENGIEAEVYAPYIPFEDIEKATRFVVQAAEGVDLVIASSMGALISLLSCDHKKLLINIAFPDDIRRIAPEYSESELSILDKRLSIKLDNVDFEDKYCMYFIFGKHDEVADNSKVISQLYNESHIYSVDDMGHSVDEHVSEKLIAAVRQILEDNKQKFTFYPFIDEDY